MLLSKLLNRLHFFLEEVDVSTYPSCLVETSSLLIIKPLMSTPNEKDEYKIETN